jgi:ferredoxin
MIVGQQKSIEDIKKMTVSAERVLVLGCGTCVAVCMAGGEKEAALLASALRMAVKLDGQAKEVRDFTVQRQCEFEYNESAAELVEWADLIVSIACGIGVQTMNEQYPQKRTVPGLNTTFLGRPMEQGVWAERCQACGNCVLDLTGGICPVSRCAKSLLNGPCGGSQQGKCEVNSEIDCAWQLIYDRMGALGMLDLLSEIQPPKDWSTSRDGGPRKIVREDLKL